MAKNMTRRAFPQGGVRTRLPLTIYRRSSEFSPTEIAGLVGWWDANDAATITLNGSNVSEWRDKSGNSRHVAMGDGANQPAYVAGSLGGKAGIDWGAGGSPRRLSRDSVSMTARDHFIVADFDGGATFSNFETLVTSGGTIPIGGESSGTTVFRGFDVFDRMQLINNASSSTALPVILNPFILRATRTSVTSSATGLHFGQFATFGNRGWAGKIYEILIYDSSLSSSAASSVQRYLAAKWGITLA
jgi:hypothetical protein